MSGSTGEKAVKVIYKTNNDEYFVVANPGMVCKWRKDKTIPLIDVVQSFDVLTTASGGNTGQTVRPSKGSLESTFGTSNVDDIVRKIVEEGVEKNM
ncbi:hypothetical protein EC973_009514 [Apophysomyces ossiformis]|uniref:Ribosome maturation protein SDO1/SBDS N-terminal domain-containing protein n=1 Tax=Apophysomyces ossiformis TaxID=679940 RepID=A0A8H7BR08_9FUNG|nr:hypothetical protein EC973_009514 [Apophysomyces ossiformis]